LKLRKGLHTFLVLCDYLELLHLLQQMQNLPDIIKKKSLAIGLGK
jgi:hypothetical protein